MADWTQMTVSDSGSTSLVAMGVQKLKDAGQWLRRDWHWTRAILGALSIVGLWSLTGVLEWWVVLIAVGAVALLSLAAYVSIYVHDLLVVAGAVVVPWLSLIGVSLIVNRVWHDVLGVDSEPSLQLGLGIAGLVFAVTAWIYLVQWREGWLAAIFVAIALAGANVVGVPVLLTRHHESHVGAPAALVSRLDAVIVVGGATAPTHQFKSAQPASPWSVQWSVARASAASLDWLLVDSSDAEAARVAARGSGSALPTAPNWRDGADHVVLLDVDGTPAVTPNPGALPGADAHPGEIGQWMSLARLVNPNAQIAALLQGTDRPRDRARLARWTRALGSRGVAAFVQQLGTRSLTDAAQVLAVQGPEASGELALAMKFRPVLLFDRTEDLKSPREIEDFLRSRRVTLCHDDRVGKDSCDPQPVLRSSDLVNGATHLKIRPPRPGDPAIASAIYVHPTESTSSGRRLLYLDYWWYLDGNPAGVGRGASCGVGLAIPGKTCFDHPSDWEGMTVVLDRRASDVPVAVQFAEHSDVVRYSYRQVRDYWAARRANPKGLSPALIRNLARVDDIRDRPLAFVANGTHATYAKICPGPGRCHQVAGGLPDNRYNGEGWWPGDDTAHCVFTSCQRLIPTRNGGRDPALWNAFTGVWGDRHCILGGAFCNYELSPGSPAGQKRYKEPAHISGYVDEKWRYHPCGGDDRACQEHFLTPGS
jgi:hypothetical protein